MSGELKLLVEAPLAAAIIGKGGLAVKRLKAESGVDTIHLSQNKPGVVDRVVGVTGDVAALHRAYGRIAALLRAEAGAAEDAPGRVRLVVPTADSLIGKRAVRRLKQACGASITTSPSTVSGAAKETLVTCVGRPAETARAALWMVDAIAERQRQRHHGFLSQWNFETNYNDHFETPQTAYKHILPLLQATASTLQHRAAKRKRDASDAAAAPIAQNALGHLTVYDPYFCQGKICEALAALGVPRERVLNANRDFYADANQRAWPSHDVLVTNPPYSSDHKQRLLDFLLAQRSERHAPNNNHTTPSASTSEGASASGQSSSRGAPGGGGAPFLLLVPAWLVATDYWQAFLNSLAEQSGRVLGRTPERRAGVFYVSPRERYQFTHPEATGHATSPFHAIWCCGGWRGKASRRAALASLRQLRRDGAVEVFRSSQMLQRRAHFKPASAAKQS